MKDFKIKIQSSMELSREEKRQILWQVFDVLFSNNKYDKKDLDKKRLRDKNYENRKFSNN